MLRDTPKGTWTDETRAVLDDLLARRSHPPPVAVFDWDDVCIRGNLADAVYLALVETLRVSFEQAGAWDWLEETGHSERVRAAYRSYCRAPEDAQAARELRYALLWARWRMHQEQDDNAAWCWGAGVFAGWTPDEVREFTRSVAAREFEHELAFESFAIPGEPPIEIHRGLRVRHAIKSLIAALIRNEWDVWVVSGSPLWEVQALAGDYGIPRERILAMSRSIGADGRITFDVRAPIPYDWGAVAAYRDHVSRTPPQLVVANNEGDWRLLEFSADVRVLVNPESAPLIEYARWRASLGERWLVEYIDP